MKKKELTEIGHKEAAAYLDYSPKYLANLNSVGKGPKGVHLCGGRLRYPVTQLHAFKVSRKRARGRAAQ